jgi:hypothetical protein
MAESHVWNDTSGMKPWLGDGPTREALVTGGRVLAKWAVRLLSEWLLSKGLLSASLAEFVSLDSRHDSHNFILSRHIQIPNINPGKFCQKYFFGHLKGPEEPRLGLAGA